MKFTALTRLHRISDRRRPRAERPWRVARHIAIATGLVAGTMTFFPLETQTAQAAGPPVTGSFFVDFDRDGTIDTNEEISDTDLLAPSGGITVTAFDPVDGSVSCDVTPGTPPTYSCDVSGLVGTDFRLEFGLTPTDIVEGWTETVRGPDSASAVQFVSAGDADVDFGVTPPSSCPVGGSSEGVLFTTCQVIGLRSSGGPQEVVVTSDYDLSSGVGILGNKTDLGSVWGVAYDEWSSTLFTSAFLQRMVDLGDEGLDGLYWQTYPTADPTNSWNSVGLGDAGFSPNGFGTDPVGNERGLGEFDELFRDAWSYPQIGKVGIGDIDISTDGRYLAATNLATKTLEIFDITPIRAGGNPSYVQSIPLANPGCPDTTNADDWAPWAVTTVDADRFYVGITCTAETSQDGSDLEANIVEVSVDAGAQGATVVDFALQYPRGCVSAFGADPSCGPNRYLFEPWNSVPTQAAANATRSTLGPILADVSIGPDGSLSVGFADRVSLQHPDGVLEPYGTSPAARQHPSGGDLVHVCNTSGNPDAPTYVVESDGGACDAGANFSNPPGTPAGDSEFVGGPGGEVEWFGADKWQPGGPGGGGHFETAQGGNWIHPLLDETVIASMDPGAWVSGGLNFFDNDDGSLADDLVLYRGGRPSDGNGYLGKGNAIGDVEGCWIPFEIGDRVWLDLDGDGVQDPGEPAMAGVTVAVLTPGGASVIGLDGNPITATTDVNGNYVFSSFDGLEPETAYTLSFDATTLTNTDILPTGVTAADLTVTTQNATTGVDGAAIGNDENDSDIDAAGEAAITTPAPGTNDHTFDAGYTLPYRLGNLVWEDTNDNGVVDDDGTEAPLAGIAVELWRDTDGDGVFDPANDTQVDTTTTGALGTATAGEYLFDEIPAGNYFVAIPQAQLDAGGPLDGYSSSSGNDVGGVAPDANNGTDNDDNGTPVAYGVVSSLVTLGDTDEPLTETGGFAASGANDEGDGAATVADGASNLTVDFGFAAPLRVGNLIWLDVDDNGTADAGEPPIPGVLVQLLDDTGAVIAETVTAADGTYLFDGLAPGDYQIAVPVDQIADDTTLQSSIDPDALTDLTSSTNGGANPAADADGNVDDVDDGEPDLANGWASITSPFTLSAGAEPTDEQGDFDGQGAANTDAEDAANAAGDTIADGNSNLTIDLGFQPPVQYRVGNLVYEDRDDSGTAEAGEPGIAGVLVQLIDDTGAVAAEVVTDTDGKYEFTGLDAGTYSVRIPASQVADDTTLQASIDSDALAESRSSGSGPTGPTGVDANGDVDNNNDGNGDLLAGADLESSTFTLGEGDDNSEPANEQLRSDDATDDDPGTQPGVVRDDRSNFSVDFGIFRKVRIGNQVWLDTGAGANEDNGTFDADEVGIGGVDVELWQDNGDGVFDPAVDTLLDTTTTDTEGNYVFGNVEPGIDVFIAVQEIPGGTLATPVTSSSAAVTTDVEAAGTTRVDNDDNGDPYVGTGTAAAPEYLSVTNAFEVEAAGAAGTGESDTIPAADDSEGDANGVTGFYPDANSDLSIDLGFIDVPLYRIGNLVWLDSNNDGAVQATEAGIPGILVQLLDDAGDVIAETVTGPDGKYGFENLVAGDYQVQIPGDQTPTLGAQPDIVAGALDRLTSSTPDTADPNAGAGGGVDNDDNGVADTPADPTTRPTVTSGTLTLGDPLDSNSEPTTEIDVLNGDADDDTGTAQISDARGNLTVDFGFYEASLGNQVWFDANNNGVIDAGEAPIPGVTVELRNAAGDVLATDTTGTDGEYLFEGLMDDAEYVVAIPASNFADGAPLDGFFSSTGNAAITDTNADIESDDNGIDPAAPGGEIVSPPVTMTVGDEPTGEGATAPAVDNDPITPDANEDLTVDFGFYTLEVGNTVFLDNDNNELLDGADAGIPGVTVNLLDSGGNVIDTQVTDGDGKYLFTGLAEGTYSVELPASNYDTGGPLVGLMSSDGPDATDTPADVDADTSDIDDNGRPADEADRFTGGVIVTEPFDLAAGDEPDDETEESPNDPAQPDTSSNLTVDLGVTPYPPLRVGNLVWEDNGDGSNTDRNDARVDAGEPGIAGVLVQLLDDASAVIAETVTDSAGNYVFDDLTPGTYQIGIPADQTPDDAGLAASIVAGALDDLVSSTGTGADPDNPDQSADNELLTDDDDGAPDVANGWASLSRTFELDYDDEPAGETSAIAPTDEEAGANALTGVDRRDTHSNLNIDFGFSPANKYRVGNLIWIDTNNDGVVDATESGIDGITVELLDESGAVIDSVITAGGGKYAFENLDAGEYSIRVPDGQAALVPYLPSNGGDVANADGDADNDDNGVTDDATDPADATGIQTNPFTLGDPGGDPFAETEPTDETAVADGGTGRDDPGTQGATSVDNLSNFSIDIGYFEPLRIGSTVWRDDGLSGGANDPALEDNGLQDGDEAGIAGVLVRLVDDAGVTVAETVTDANGDYVFDGLSAGTYEVIIPGDQTPELPGTPAPTAGALDGLRSSTNQTGTDADSGAAPGANEATNADDDGIGDIVNGADITSGPVVLDYGTEPEAESNTDEDRISTLTGVPYADNNSQLQIDFGLSPVPTYRIGNLVFADSNDNGVAEAGEPGIPGVLVQLTDAAGTVLAETVTDSNGNYDFDDLPAGEYRVQIPADQIADDTTLQASIDADALADSRASGATDSFAPTDPDDDQDNDTEVTAAIGDPLTDLVSGILEVGEGTGNDEPAGDATGPEVDRDTAGDDDDPGAGDTRDDRSNVTVDFGIFRKVRIGNQVWLDEGPGNGGANTDNGQFDDDEVGIVGVTVELWLDNGDGTFDPAVDTLVDSTVTDGEGNYLFAGVEPGLEVFVAVETIPDGATPSGSASSSGSAPVGAPDAARVDNDDNGAPYVGTGTAAAPQYVSVTDVFEVPAPGNAPLAESDTVPGADDSEGDANGITGDYPDGNSDLSIDLGFIAVPLYRIGNLVWLDGNNSGEVDATESGIPGVLVQLLDDAGTVIAETVTGPDGKYGFDNLVAGDYQVRIPGDQTPTLGAQPDLDPTAIEGLTSSFPVDPGTTPEEADPNTDVDNDDNGIVDGDDFTSGTLTLGSAATTNSEPEDEVDVIDGGADDDTGTGSGAGVISDARGNLSVDFGFYGLSLGNQIWFDTNNDGLIDPDEEPIVGVTVELWEYNGTGDDTDIANYTLVDMTMTEALGEYLFTGLEDATTYKVVVPATNFADGASLDGFFSSDGNADITNTDADVDSDDNGIDPANQGEAVESPPVTMRAGDEPVDDANGDPTNEYDNDPFTDDASEDLTVDMGFYQLALGDTIFRDSNNDGLLNGLDAGIADVVVELYIDTDMNGTFDPAVDTLVGTDTTDADGRYYFSGLGEDTYFVHVPADEFGAGEPLDGLWSSTGNGAAPDPDDDETENDDNGDPVDGAEFTNGVVTPAITLVAGGEPTADDNDDPDGRNLADASENTTIDLGFYTLEVGNTIFRDIDNNEVFDGVDEGIQGVVVNLLDGDGDPVLDAAGDPIIATTDPLGKYLFTGLPEGEYIVAVDPSNFVGGGPLAGTYSSDGPDAVDAPVDVDDDTSDVDDNGAPVDITQKYSGGQVQTLPFDLSAGDEPDDETEESPNDPTIGDTESNLTVDLGFTEIPTLELGNQLWFDLDNNGTFDVGEAPLPDGVVVNLLNDDGTPALDAGGAPLTVTTAGGAGQYLFTDLDEGTYIVQLDPANFDAGGPLAGFGPSTGPASSTDPNDNVENNNDGFLSPDIPGVVSGPVELTFGAEPTAEVDAPTAGTRNEFSNLTVDIGLVPALELGNQVFIDVANDGDGTGDAAAPAGVVVNLLDDSGAVVQTTTTDAAGQYLFTGLAPGDYVVELPASNFVPGGPLDGFHGSSGPAISSDPNDDVDNNSDGIVQADRSLRSGPVSLVLSDEPTSEIDPAVTTENDFSNLSVDFGVYQLELPGTVFSDFDNDGDPDGGGSPIAGVLVNLLDADGTPVLDAAGNPITATTDADGNYTFTGLMEGDYLIELDPSNFDDTGPLAETVSSTPTDGTDEGRPDGDSVVAGPITLTAGADAPSVDFGLTPSASVGDSVWSDTDRDGVRDPAELGLGGVTIELLDASGTVVATTTSATDGSYLFDDLPPGDYSIRVVASTLPGGAVITTQNAGGNDATDSDVSPVSFTTVVFTLDPGEDDVSQDIGVVLAGDLPATGSDTGNVIRTALYVLLAGLVVFGLARRRRTPTVTIG